MFINYGDKIFWEYGCLVDAERAELTSVHIIYCRPFDEPDPDGNTVYYFAGCDVDTTDSWIDKQAVLSFAGLKAPHHPQDTEWLIQYAIACVDFYGAEEFASPYDGFQHDEDYIREFLKHRLIAYDNLEI